MVDDDQVAEHGKRVGIGALAFVDGDAGRALVRRDLDAVALDRGTKTSLLLPPEGRGDVAGNRRRKAAANRRAAATAAAESSPIAIRFLPDLTN